MLIKKNRVCSVCQLLSSSYLWDYPQMTSVVDVMGFFFLSKKQQQRKLIDLEQFFLMNPNGYPRKEFVTFGHKSLVKLIDIF